MAFNPEDKVKYGELSTSLQQLIDSKGSSANITNLENSINTITNAFTTQIGGIRITLGDTPPSQPVLDKEIWWPSTKNVPKRFSSGGWVSANAVYK